MAYIITVFNILVHGTAEPDEKDRIHRFITHRAF